jgi:hypothetical protein
MVHPVQEFGLGNRRPRRNRAPPALLRQPRRKHTGNHDNGHRTGPGSPTDRRQETTISAPTAGNGGTGLMEWIAGED